MLSSLPFAPAGPHGVDPLVLLVMALLAEAIFGPFKFLFRVAPHPRALVASAVDWLERKLNREQRSESTRAFRGLLALAAVASAAAVVGLALGWLARNHPFGWIVAFPLMVALFAQRESHQRAGAVANALDDHLEAARRAIERFGERNAEALDHSGVARAALERLAEAFAGKVVAPAFGYVLFGLAGLFVVAAVGAMNDRIGEPSPGHRAFGRWTARARMALEFFPARFAGLFLVLAAPLARRAKTSFGGALTAMLRDATKYRAPNMGWPVAAMAGALGADPSGARPASANDVRRALRLYIAACAVNVVFVAALALAR